MERYDAIVVGGGISGLTAAAYLAKAKTSVLLLEKNDRCGGLVNSFSREGFLFDGGVRALLSAGIILPMLEELGIDLKIVESPVSVGIEDHIIHISSEENVEDYSDLLKRLYPESLKEIDRVITLVKRIIKDMEVMYGVDNPLFKDFKKDRAEFARVYFPWLFKFLFTLKRIGAMKMPVEELLDKLVENRSLKDIIGQHFFKSTPAFFAMSYFHLYLDYFYPVGGVGRLSQSVEEKTREFGGKILTSREVREIDSLNRIVRDSNGDSYEYDQLIWTGDLKSLYEITRTDGLPEATRKRVVLQRERLLERHGADSVFTLFIAVDEPPETFRAISNGHFFYTPSRKGLGETNRSELKKLLENWVSRSESEISDWIRRFCELNTYEITIPVLRDKTAAPENKTALIISILCEYEFFSMARESGLYEEIKAQLEKQIIEVLSDSIYPFLKERILFSFSSSPLTIEESVGSSEGSIVGWSFEEPVPVTSSMMKVNSSVKTEIPDVLQAGKWAYSPSGVPMCILTGKLAANKALKEFKVKHIK